MNLSCEVSLDDYSDTIAAGVSSRSGTHSGLCMKLWVISLVWIDLFVITMPNISIKQPQNISKNSGGFAPGPPCLHFLLTTINKLDPDFRSGGLTHVTPNTESVSAGLTDFCSLLFDWFWFWEEKHFWGVPQQIGYFESANRNQRRQNRRSQPMKGFTRKARSSAFGDFPN